MGKSVLRQTQKQLTDWLTDWALPFWVEKGISDRNGFAYDYLAADGTAGQHGWHSLSVQAMQIYAFSRATKMSWMSNSQGVIERMISSAILLGTSPCRSNGFLHLLDADMRTVDADHYVTDHAWFMMSSAAAWHAFSRGTELRRSYNIFEWLQQRYARGAGWSEGSSAGRSLRLSTQIQMCEAIVYIYECCGKEKWAGHAAAFLQHFNSHIFDGTIASLTEFRGPDWTPDRSSGWLSPGDLYHLVTLLDRIGQATSMNTREIALGIWRQTLPISTGCESGLVPHCIDSNGRELNGGYHLSDLLKQISAAITVYRLGEDSALDTLESGVRTLIDRYVDPGTPGLMREVVNLDGGPGIERYSAANLSRIVDLAIQLAYNRPI